MKTTMNLPDNLYRKVKTRAAQQGRTVRDVTVELYERWLDLGRRISEAMPPGENLRDEIRASRDRLDPK